MTTPGLPAWEVETRLVPRRFTREAWESLTPRQRDMIHRQRVGVVEALAIEHQRRYHSARNLVALAIELHDEATNG